MKIFVYNNATGDLELNQPEILLIKEFETLFSLSRNKCPQDPSGIRRIRAFKEFRYIYLAIDWTSPYMQYDEGERHEDSLLDAGMTEEDFHDPDFKAACRKYIELQESSKSFKLIKAIQGVVDKITDYFNDLDLTERDPVTNKPIFKTKDVIVEMQNASTIIDQMKALELAYKREIQESDTKIRGDARLGAFD